MVQALSVLNQFGSSRPSKKVPYTSFSGNFELKEPHGAFRYAHTRFNSQSFIFIFLAFALLFAGDVVFWEIEAKHYGSTDFDLFLSVVFVTKTDTETGYALNAEVVKQNGTLILTADFETLSLAGNDSVIRVSADLFKNTVTGRVYYYGMAGTLEGRISPDFVQGAFQGQGDGKIFADGLKGTKVQP